MSIKYHYGVIQNISVIRIHTLLTKGLILIIRVIHQFHLSFLIESFHFNFGKGEVMHNEETI